MRRAVGIAIVVAVFALGPAACADGETTPRTTDRPTSTARSEPADNEQAESPRPTRSFDLDRSTPADEPEAPAESTRPPLAASPDEQPPAEQSRPAEIRPGESQPGDSQPAGEEPAASQPAAEQPAAEEPAAEEPTPDEPSAEQSAAAAAEDDGIGVGPLVCLLVVIVAALVVGGLLVSRSQRRSAWDREAQELRGETLAATESRLPPVLNTTAAADRTVVWPPIRAGLVGIVGRWDALVGTAAGESRRDWALRISGLLQDLIAAVDMESEGITVGRSWQTLRPAVLEAQQALAAALTTHPESPPTVTPGQPQPY
ncbi:hypothetical protein [Cryptosporangium aurantiacum]|uniref:Uncharacterized protein n=1 Tax=Cryptosporangium aurantiacum TaxID=134849 RepID=A0A1M7Q859_9ACTN|nr:hypothetical protein [Cryptosporangium aurantiacum]SHN26542.1 hypothetical protein SAMN05443668_104274 [Cryptosporangium aurantiacum]